MNDIASTGQGDVSESTNTELPLFTYFSRMGDTSEDTRQFIEEAGTAILESAILRFVGSASEEELEVFDGIVVQNEQNPDRIIPTAIEKLPRLSEVLSEEIEAFRAEANERMGEGV